MTLTDNKGIKYKLTKTRLITLDNDFSPSFQIRFDDVRKHSGRSAQLYINDNGPSYYVRVPIRENSIGCREFSEETMRIIKEAISI